MHLPQRTHSVELLALLTVLGLIAGEVIKPKGAFQRGMFYLMPAIQPLASLLLAGLSTYTIALAGVAALHFQPYIAPLLVRFLVQHHVSSHSCLPALQFQPYIAPLLVRRFTVQHHMSSHACLPLLSAARA